MIAPFATVVTWINAADAHYDAELLGKAAAYTHLAIADLVTVNIRMVPKFAELLAAGDQFKPQTARRQSSKTSGQPELILNLPACLLD